MFYNSIWYLSPMVQFSYNNGLLACGKLWLSLVIILNCQIVIAKLSQAPVPASAGGLSLALFSFNPPTRPPVRNISEIA